MNKTKLIIASAYAAIISIIFVVLITVWAELSVPLKDWLKAFSGHHWTSKSIFSVLLYAIATVIFFRFFREPDEISLRRALTLSIWFSVFGVIALTAFYTGHHFQFF